jgi:hypothetical protein
VNTMTLEERAAALAEFPQLQRLADLRDAGWAFFPTVLDAQIVHIYGMRTWPEGWADVICIRGTTDAAALRSDYTGSVTWQRDGTLTDVIDGLIALPAPDDRLAPRLVIGQAPM